jgi:hypothetical protein
MVTLMNLVCNFTTTTMDIQSEMRLIQIGPGISVSYTIFSSESTAPGDSDTLEGGRAGDLFISPSTLYFKNKQNLWMVVAEGDRVYNPSHEYCRLLLSDSGPRWGYHGNTPGVTIAEAIKQHLERIKHGEEFMPEDDDNLDDDDEDEDDHSETEEREE